jgi:hypothetical protein
MIRDAQYAIDHGDAIFTPQFKEFFRDTCSAAIGGLIQHDRTSEPPSQVDRGE